MAAVRSQALVLRSTDVFETSRVLTLYTRELGKVSALAKGARRLRSPFQSALDLLSVCDIVLLHKASEALDLLTEAVLVERFGGLGRDLGAYYAGLYVAELLGELTLPHDPHPRWFDAAVVTLRHLADPALRLRRIGRFELACLRELGVLPALDVCVGCGQRIDEGVEAVAFGLATGGVLCPQCRPGQAFVATLSGATVRALRALAEPGDAWRAPALIAAEQRQVRETLGAIISHHLGRRPRMLDWI